MASDRKEMDSLSGDVPAEGGQYSRRRVLGQTLLYGTALSAAGAGLFRPDIANAASLKINAYPFGTKPVASNIQGAIKFWLDATNDAVPSDSPDVVLTDAEIKQLRSMGVTVGHTWYGFFVPTVAGWNKFWKASVDTWAKRTLIYNVDGKPQRDISGIKLMIDQHVPVVGTLAVDWVEFSAAMRMMHSSNTASTSVVAPSSAYYPTTSTIMPDQVEDYRALVLPMAKKLRSEGIKEADVLLLTVKYPAYFDVARLIGIKQGLSSPEVNSICKMRIIGQKPVGLSTSEGESVTSSAMLQFPKLHVVIGLGPIYIGAAAAIRNAGRKDVWIIASDLDAGVGANLVNGGWPVYVTYSLPIVETGIADANVMGKILLGKKVPLIVRTKGTVTTPENVNEAWKKDWGNTKRPF